MKNKKYQLFLFSLLILFGSSIPSNSIPKAVSLTPDKILHFAEYFIWGILCFRVFINYFSSPIIYVILVGAIFGILDETWQSMIPGRESSKYDVLVDIIGVVVSSLICNYYVAKKT